MTDSIPCRACGAKARYVFSGSVIGETVRYYECDTCRFVETEEPYWLDKAYASAINQSDTGLVSRNIYCARITALTLLLMRKHKGRVVDFAGGYGLLTRLLRDMGFDARWSDPYCTNLLAQGFVHDGSPAELVTAFEAFEHFVDPVAETEKMFAMAPTILLSTTLCPTPTPPHADWWYYGKEHGQHIGLFRTETLAMIAQKFNARLISNGQDIHVLTRSPIPETLWKYALTSRFMGVVPRIARSILGSRTFSDHELIAARLS